MLLFKGMMEQLWLQILKLATALYAGTGAGTAPASLAMGGRAPPFSTAVEEFTAETTALNVKDLTQS